MVSLSSPFSRRFIRALYYRAISLMRTPASRESLTVARFLWPKFNIIRFTVAWTVRCNEIEAHCDRSARCELIKVHANCFAKASQIIPEQLSALQNYSESEFQTKSSEWMHFMVGSSYYALLLMLLLMHYLLARPVPQTGRNRLRLLAVPSISPNRINQTAFLKLTTGSALDPQEMGPGRSLPHWKFQFYSN